MTGTANAGAGTGVEAFAQVRAGQGDDFGAWSVAPSTACSLEVAGRPSQHSLSREIQAGSVEIIVPSLRAGAQPQTQRYRRRQQQCHRQRRARLRPRQAAVVSTSIRDVQWSFIVSPEHKK
ncbi:MAG: hypothetical protein K0U66_01600 [Gammaproteobacteria bacterium]|nr:hypothetical protein [Gammaproteobacteria bacterium]